MKKYISLLLAVFLFASCTEDTTTNVSSRTYYPELELIGDEIIILEKGATFNDPGVIATENGEVIDYTVSYSGKFRGGTTLNTNVEDVYTLTYTAINKDGFPATINRQVIIASTGNLTSDISGLYLSTVTRNGILTAQYTDLEYVLIWKRSDGKYQISDGIGGYYDLGRSYGSSYIATPAVVEAVDIPTNTFNYSTFGVLTFGGTCTMSAMSVDASAKTISFNTEWTSGYTFNVFLEQVEL